jgi:hypothetical protein
MEFKLTRNGWSKLNIYTFKNRVHFIISLCRLTTLSNKVRAAIVQLFPRRGSVLSLPASDKHHCIPYQGITENYEMYMCSVEFPCMFYFSPFYHTYQLLLKRTGIEGSRDDSTTNLCSIAANRNAHYYMFLPKLPPEILTNSHALTPTHPFKKKQL